MNLEIIVLLGIAILFYLIILIVSNKKDKKQKVIPELVAPTRIIKISDKSLLDFYEALSYEQQLEFTKIVIGHQCYHSYCCDREELITNMKSREFSIFEFLKKYGFLFYLLKDKYITFYFSRGKSQDRRVIFYNPIDEKKYRKEYYFEDVENN